MPWLWSYHYLYKTNLWSLEPSSNIFYTVIMFDGFVPLEGTSLIDWKGVAAEGMIFHDHVWHGYNPISVTTTMEDGVTVIDLIIAGVSLMADQLPSHKKDT